MKKIDLTKGRVISVIAALALPIMGSSLLQFTYNLIDMIWVGKLGSNAVASIGSSSLYVNIGNAINALVVIGTGIKVAHAIGRKDNDEVNKYINSGIIINLIMGIVFGIVLIFSGKGFIGFLGLNNSEVEKNAYYYLALNAPILFFAFFNMMYTRILGSFGNNKLAFKINGVGVILNIILDPVCIYIFNLGVIGAGISTLIANIIMFILFRIKSNGIL
ncbi:MATE family efflux transporter, partial [Clostridium butyricum]